MKTYVKNRMECGERVHLFSELPELVLTPTETALFTSLATNLSNMRAWGVEQVSGNLAFRDGALDRKSVAVRIRGKMRSISRLAKSMELGGVPGVTTMGFRMPAQRTYAVLAAAAQAFADAAEPHKARFVERGLAATFVEDLEALIPLLATAGDDRATGLIEQTAGSAGLDALAAEVLKLVQQLRPILEEHLKNEPALLGAWRVASRVAASSATEPASMPEVPGGSSGSGTTPQVGN